jgi:hypothetical protein
MFDIGLVFDIRFTEDELEQLPRWNLFDRKITDGISALSAMLKLPSRPSAMQDSANSTLWSFVQCDQQALRGQYGRWVYHLNLPGPITASEYTLEALIQRFGIPNPISSPDDTLAPPQQLIIIGALFGLHIQKTLFLTL